MKQQPLDTLPEAIQIQLQVGHPSQHFASTPAPCTVDHHLAPTPALCTVDQLMRLGVQLQFERLVVLDYITRNTDRGNDNWLIRYLPVC